MPLKKIIKTKSASREEIRGPIKKKLPPKPIEDDDELEEEVIEGDEEVVEEEEEIVRPKKKLAARRPEPEEDGEEEGEEEERPVVRKGAKLLTKKKSALSDAFDNSPQSRRSAVPTGPTEAVIKEMVYQDQSEEGKGIKVRIKAECCQPDYEGVVLTDWRTLETKTGEANQTGIDIFREELAKLGYEVKFSQLEQAFDEINEENPGVIVNVRYDHYQGRDFQHFSIANPCDNEVVEAYKDSVKY